MIPSLNGFSMEAFKIKKQPSRTFKMNIRQEAVCGITDGKDAMRQAIYKILNTERYQHIIYSWNYGIECVDLIGKTAMFVCPELKRRITEALVQDDRILSVDAFEFNTEEKGEIYVTFTAHTIFGDIEVEKVVDI